METNFLKWFALFAVTFSVPAYGQSPGSSEKAKLQKNISSVAIKPTLISPTAANVAYGQHPRQVLDFWQAKSDVPTPVVFFIHGGGWMSGDKSRVKDLQQYLDAGISVVSINYRYVSQAVAAGVSPPVKAPLHDAARALQFIRSKSSEWNIEKTRIGASGGSAGACSSLWLAFHDDLAEKDSSDPIARESTRLDCAAVTGAQTTLDPVQMRKWIPNSRYGSHAFGIFKVGGKQFQQDFDAFYARRDELADWINEYSPYSLVTKDDAPVYLFYDAAPVIGKDAKDPTHSANFGLLLQEKLNEVGVSCELAYPGTSKVQHANVTSYLIDQLKH